MNNISVNFNNRNLIFAYRDIMRTTGVTEKNIDLQTITELYNENVYRLTQEHLSGQKLVIDAGSHIGTFSIMAAALGANRVYALEPNLENLEQLKLNIANNNFENVIIPINKALWHNNDPLIMDTFYSDSRAEKLFSLESDQSKAVTQSNNQNTFRATTIALDQLLKEYGVDEIDVLKMDIEWSEYEIIKSLSDDTMAKIKYLCLEFHGTDKETFGTLVAHLTRQFRVETLGSYERGGFIWARRY